MAGKGHSARRAFGAGNRWLAVLVGLAAALIAALALATPARAEVTPPAPHYFPVTVHSPKGQERGRWAERTRVAGDLNYDGVNDLWVGVPRYQRDNPHDTFGFGAYGRVYAVDGASLADPLGQKKYPKILYKIHPPEPQENRNFGFVIENIGDVSGDGIADIAVGTDAQDVPVAKPGQSNNTQVCDTGRFEPEPNRCHELQGKAWVFDGKTNKVLYELNNPHPQGSLIHRARFGSRLGKAGDINGDGASEVIAGASGNDEPPGCSDAGGPVAPGCRREEGEAFVFDGRTGALVRTLKLPEEDDPRRQCSGSNPGESCGQFGLSVQGVGDVDGDNVPDQLVGAPHLQVGANRSQGRIYVYSGASGKAVDDDPIRRIDDPQPHYAAIFGFQDVTPLDPGDVNDDGHADIYGFGFFQTGEGGFGQGKAWVFDGAKGTAAETPMLYEVQNPNREAGAQCCWSMTRDRNRNRGASDPPDDGGPVTNPLYVGSAPHLNRGPVQNGQTNTFNAATGSLLHTLELPPPWAAEVSPNDLGPNLGWTVSSPGDLNRDGFRDFIAGAPFTNVCHVRLGTTNQEQHLDQGVMIAFVSTPDNDPPPPNDRNPADNVCTEDQPGE